MNSPVTSNDISAIFDHVLGLGMFNNSIFEFKFVCPFELTWRTMHYAYDDDDADGSSKNGFFC